MGIVAYNWMKTYLPREPTQCPDGASIFIKEAAFDEGTSQLTLTIKNNGRFNILGYYIYAANDSEKEVATVDLSGYFDNSSGGIIFGNSVSFAKGSDNSFVANEEATHVFNIPEEIGTIYLISITPVRIETEDNKEKFTVCSNLGVVGNVGGPSSEQIPICGNGVIESGEQCDDDNLINNDGCSSTCTTETPASCNNNNVVDPPT